MKGIFWNMRGMGAIEKMGLLHDMIKDNNADFVGIMETMKQDFNPGMLRGISGQKTFHWDWMPATGKSGGILVGINTEKFNVLDVSKGKFCVKLELMDNDTKAHWDLVVVYGAAQNEEKSSFLSNLADLLHHQKNPIVMGGDFNIIRKESEKNKSGGYNKWSFIFNAIIEQVSLRELHLGGRQFTWSNNLENPTLEKLDRVFISTEWEEKFPLTDVKTLPRGLSDHNPLLFSTGEASLSHYTFKFELSWFLREDLNKVVEDVWNKQYHGSSLEKWQLRLKALRKKLNGWNKNWEGMYRREKQRILSQIDALDAKAENLGVSATDREERRELESRLRFVIREEKIKWFQRSKEKEVLEGDCNTKYFHAKANGRKRKSQIHMLVQDGVCIEGQRDLMMYITNFYKNLFGHSQEVSISLSLDNVMKVTEEDAIGLITPVTMEELRNVVFDLKKNKSPGPDGMPGEFYIHFWDLIKHDLLDLINDFQRNSVNIDRLNFGVITLIPKTKDASQIQKFRPICLLNVSFKIITKVLMNRLNGTMAYIISKQQTAFLKNRFIMEGVVILHEVLNSIHQKKQSGILFKVDFEKAYDKVNWVFIYKMLKAKGFPDQWCDWIMKVVMGGKVAVKVNDQIGSFFKTHKGLRQGDPLSPLLFNLAAEALTLLVQRAEENSLIEGLGTNGDNKIAILQYADDTIFLINDKLDHAKNLKYILCLFEQLSGLKINFNKSEVFCFGEAKEKQDLYSNIFTCKVGSLPLKYLGIPIDQKRILNKDWKLAENKMEHKLGCWQGRLQSIGGRLILLNSTLSSVPMYMISFYKLPKGVQERIDYFRKRFLWQEDQGIRKYHLVNWPLVCSPRDQGGLGVLDLEAMNKAMLGKWIWRLENEEGWWQEIIYAKYCSDKPLSGLRLKAGSSHFWQGVMEVKDDFFFLLHKNCGEWGKNFVLGRQLVGW